MDSRGRIFSRPLGDDSRKSGEQFGANRAKDSSVSRHTKIEEKNGKNSALECDDLFFTNPFACDRNHDDDDDYCDEESYQNLPFIKPDDMIDFADHETTDLARQNRFFAASLRAPKIAPKMANDTMQNNATSMIVRYVPTGSQNLSEQISSSTTTTASHHEHHHNHRHHHHYHRHHHHHHGNRFKLYSLMRNSFSWNYAREYLRTSQCKQMMTQFFHETNDTRTIEVTCCDATGERRKKAHILRASPKLLQSKSIDEIGGRRRRHGKRRDDKHRRHSDRSFTPYLFSHGLVPAIATNMQTFGQNRLTDPIENSLIAADFDDSLPSSSACTQSSLLDHQYVQPYRTIASLPDVLKSLDRHTGRDERKRVRTKMEKNPSSLFETFSSISNFISTASELDEQKNDIKEEQQ